MTQKIYGLVSDCGDGSSCMHWFRDEKIVEQCLEHDCESYGMNEGVPAETLEFPDELNLEKCGFSFFDEYVDMEE